METIYFLLIISAVLVASILILRRINKKSYVVGGKIDKVNRELEKVKQQLKDPDSQQEQDYVEWFEARNRPTMAELAREAEEEREYMGVATMNDGFEPASSNDRSQAMH